MDETRTPFRVQCRPCGHVWVAAWLPMPLTAAGNILTKLMCPMCGAGSHEIYGYEDPINV